MREPEPRPERVEEQAQGRERGLEQLPALEWEQRLEPVAAALIERAATEAEVEQGQEQVQELPSAAAAC